jgi:predicted AlkP superfamily phosphohydrolase/phosphomutase
MDVDIVRELVARGAAPTFAALWETAAFAATENPRGFLVGATWPTLWSGVWPNRHGWYGFRQLVSGTYELRPASPGEIEYEPFWIRIARAGRRVRVYDVPLAPLSSHSNCVQVVEWGGHDLMLGAKSSPADEFDTLERDVGAYAVQGECDDYARRGAFQQLHDDLLRGVEQRTRATLRAVELPDWDLLVTVFSESHCAGHNLWGHRDLLEDVYEAVDRAVGEIMAALGSDVTVVVLLSHGMATPCGAEHLFAEVVRRLDDSYGAAGRFVTMRERVLRPLGRWVHGRRYRNVDWSRAIGPARLESLDSSRRFFALPSIGLGSYIRFNLAGREPRGRVRPGAELERLTESLRRDLLDLVDEDTGQGVVRDVWRTADVYSGSTDVLPDLVIDWEPNARSATIGSPRIGVVRRPPGGIRTGEHRAPGTLFVRRPEVAPGPLEDDVQAVDVAPTVMAMLGVTPQDLDGRVVASLVAT